MSIEYSVLCDSKIPGCVREKIVNKSNVINITEREPDTIAVDFRIAEEHTEVTKPSFSCYIREKEITVVVHSAVWYAHTAAAYLIIEAFKDSGASFRIEEI